MTIEGFNYQEFAENLSAQAGELIPKDFNEFQRNYVINTLKNFSTVTGEAISNDKEAGFTIEQAMLLTQIIAEWSFHKSCDLCRSGIMPDYWNNVMKKIAFTIFEIGKQAIKQNMPQNDMLEIIEAQVKKTYNESVEDLLQKGYIDARTKEIAETQSNIDAMMEDMSQNEAAKNDEAPQTQQNEGKLLKLASIALLMKKLPKEKCANILSRLNQDDTNTVIQYMQMEDLELKIDKGIALKCLQEIKSNLPEPKKVNPSKIIKKLHNILDTKGREKVEKVISHERSNVQEFITTAYNGDTLKIPTKVANIIAQYIENSV